MAKLNLQPVHVYGLTETYGPITKGYYLPQWDTIPAEDKYKKMARQGHGFLTSLPVRVIKTDVPEGTIIDVEKNGEEIGEVVFVGNICAKGYYKNVEDTKKLFSGGVLHSGDLAVWHPDGAIQILDRAKDIIISGKYARVLLAFPFSTSSISREMLRILLARLSRRRKHILCCIRVHACNTSGHI